MTEFGLRDHDGQLVGQVEESLRAHPRMKAILLANHGLLAWDASSAATAQLVVTIEEGAAIILGAAAFGGSRPIPLPAS